MVKAPGLKVRDGSHLHDGSGGRRSRRQSDYFEDPGGSILRDQGGSVLRAHFNPLSQLLRSSGCRFSATPSAAFLRRSTRAAGLRQAMREDGAMRYGSCVLAIMLMASPIGQDSKNQESSATEQSEFSRLETLWNEAHRAGDADKLDGLWGEDLVVTVPRMPVMTKTQAITIWRSGRMKFRRYETSEIRSRQYGDAAVVTGRLRRSREVNGREIQDDWRFTKVYVRRSDKWQVVAWHASESAPE